MQKIQAIKIWNYPGAALTPSSAAIPTPAAIPPAAVPALSSAFRRKFEQIKPASSYNEAMSVDGDDEDEEEEEEVKVCL